MPILRQVLARDKHLLATLGITGKRLGRIRPQVGNYLSPPKIEPIPISANEPADQPRGDERRTRLHRNPCKAAHLAFQLTGDVSPTLWSNHRSETNAA